MLESAVRKLRARQSLTEGERVAVRRRGAELLEEDLTDEPPSGPIELDDGALEDQDEDEMFEDLVLLDANDREGIQGIPWREAFAQLGIPLPPE